MREIKFREWDATREDIYGKGYGMSYSKRVEYDDNTSFRFSHEEDLGHDGWDKIGAKRYRKLMQYTGLKDMTGKEIYEGDVISIFSGYCYEQRIITFKDGSFVARLIKKFVGDEDALDSDIYLTDVESLLVIGNICENPEFL